MAISQAVKNMFKGISWRNPMINFVLHALDPFDSIIRRANGLGHLPPYSTRVRSNGVTGQFGGQRFAYYGKIICQLLQNHAFLKPESRILEIGCGCGRIALALAQIHVEWNYSGMDIEKVSLDASRRNSLLRKKGFRFDLMDIYNLGYNPQGKHSGSSYVFPYPDQSFDVIILISVFTHMLPPDVSNYVKEIGRLLSPNGTCLMSTFLLDHGRFSNGLSFPYDRGEYCIHQETVPEKAVGYYLNFFKEKFSKYNMDLRSEPMLGLWRNSSIVEPTTEFTQDILIFCRESESIHRLCR